MSDEALSAAARAWRNAMGREMQDRPNLVRVDRLAKANERAWGAFIAEMAKRGDPTAVAEQERQRRIAAEQAGSVLLKRAEHAEAVVSALRRGEPEPAPPEGIAKL